VLAQAEEELPSTLSLQEPGRYLQMRPETLLSWIGLGRIVPISRLSVDGAAWLKFARADVEAVRNRMLAEGFVTRRSASAEVLRGFSNRATQLTGARAQPQ
jgi:hypothetical protein